MAHALAHALPASSESRLARGLKRAFDAFVAWRMHAARQELARHGIYINETEIILAGYRRISLDQGALPFRD